MKPLWLFGPPGSGKTTLARHVQLILAEKGTRVVLLDSDEMRRGPMLDLGFSAADRTENIIRLAIFAGILAEHQALPIVAAVTPTLELRRIARELCDPLLVMLSGGPSRLWPGTTFEAGGADVSLNTEAMSPLRCVESIIGALEEGGWL